MFQHHRTLTRLGLACLAIASLALAGPTTAAQVLERTASEKGAGPPRTPDGRPDLQGVWDFATLTPMERPKEFGDKAVLTEQEAAEYARQRLEANNKDRRGTGAADVAGAYNDFWWDYGSSATRQTSLVVDPKDGQIPAVTREAQERLAQRAPRYDNPEDRPLAERCIMGFNAGPPMTPSAYNNNVQIVQTPDYVVIMNEMIHTARIVPLDNRPAPAPHLRFMAGDSRGRWEGDTLVVETKSFLRQTSLRGSSPHMRLEERFTRVDAGTLRYEFTVTDPTTWVRPWTASVPMKLSDELIYEYACHEGNYAMEGVLKGGRLADELAAKQKSNP